MKIKKIIAGITALFCCTGTLAFMPELASPVHAEETVLSGRLRREVTVFHFRIWVHMHCQKIRTLEDIGNVHLRQGRIFLPH